MATLTTLDESILEAKRMLDRARQDGCADLIREWTSRLNTRLDRKSALMRAAKETPCSPQSASSS